jgi:dihydroorotate dehydrogenase electron transfer subunit
MDKKKKVEMDFIINENVKISAMYSLLKLSPVTGDIPEMLPGQFVQIEVPNSKETYLRRPISINYVDREQNELWLLIRKAGKGTEALINMPESSELNIILPLGNGFTTDLKGNVLLIGGGVGVAPLLFLGKTLKDKGIAPMFLLGAKSSTDLLELEMFKKIGDVYCTTEDGTKGEKGFVTQHSVLNNKITHIACCGPQPMMKAVAKVAKTRGIDCEVSLENMMACGLGACLCCVEDTIDQGNVCVCKEGPVFNINRLKW